MTIESLTSEDEITVINEAISSGATMGVVETYTLGATKKCLVQENSRGTSQEYQARGHRVDYELFFSANPSLSIKTAIRWLNKATNEYEYMRVTGHYQEGRPGEWMLWVVEAERITSRIEVVL